MLRKTKRSIDFWPHKAGRCARENFIGRILLSSSEKWLLCIHSMFSRSTSVGAKIKAASFPEASACVMLELGELHV